MKTIVMPTTAETIESTGLWQRWSTQIAELTKARLTCLVLVTTLVGFYQGGRGATDWGLLWHTLFGTALVAAASSALNQLLEIQWDAKMRRTSGRPLPAGKLHPDEVLIFAFVSAVAGLAYLLWMVNFLAALVAALTLASYLFVYTPLKRYSTLNTVVGAIPGALPPVLGWVAANGKFTVESGLLFAILFLWQMPHFLAIAWRCREDYARAGFKMLPLFDPTGVVTGRQAFLYAAALLPVSLWPTGLRMTGVLYFWVALFLGLVFLVMAADFWRMRDDLRARRLFWTSILYLPLLLGTMAFDLHREG
jgi:heme o synthase